MAKTTEGSKTTSSTTETKAAASSAENTAPTQIQVAQSAMIRYNRPVEPSHLEVTGTLMGNRPIVKTESALSITLIQPEDAAGVMANRPIAATNLEITSMLMNRPVASNQIDDPNTLMGYLD